MSASQSAPTAQPEPPNSAARFTVLAVGIAVAITAGDPTILAGNLGKIVSGLNVSVDTASFIAGLATLTWPQRRWALAHWAIYSAASGSL